MPNKNPARFPARAHFVSFNFTRNLIRAIGSSGFKCQFGRRSGTRCKLVPALSRDRSRFSPREGGDRFKLRAWNDPGSSRDKVWNGPGSRPGQGILQLHGALGRELGRRNRPVVCRFGRLARAAKPAGRVSVWPPCAGAVKPGKFQTETPSKARRRAPLRCADAALRFDIPIRACRNSGRKFTSAARVPRTAARTAKPLRCPSCGSTRSRPSPSASSRG